MNRLRRLSRELHRHASYFFAGVVLIYAISGIALNHKGTFNSNYEVRRNTFEVSGELPERSGVDEAWVKRALLSPVGEEGAYTKHYFPQDNVVKVFLKGGSSVVADLSTGRAEYESLKRRPFFGAVSRLHYNPGRWWTLFSDIFAGALILVTITGFTMMKGRRGLIGWGGAELLAGLLFPLAFLLFF